MCKMDILQHYGMIAAETEQRNQQPTVVQSDTDSANFAWRIMMVWWTYPSEGFLKVAFTEREIFNQLLKAFILNLFF